MAQPQALKFWAVTGAPAQTEAPGSTFKSLMGSKGTHHHHPPHTYKQGKECLLGSRTQAAGRIFTKSGVHAGFPSGQAFCSLWVWGVVVRETGLMPESTGVGVG